MALEEKIRVLQASRDELHLQSTSQSMKIGDLQSKNSQISIENEAFKHRISDLQQVTKWSIQFKPYKFACIVYFVSLK